jgi:hypothetical protein
MSELHKPSLETSLDDDLRAIAYKMAKQMGDHINLHPTSFAELESPVQPTQAPFPSALELVSDL